MQIHGLHKNIYRLYAYARTQECLEIYRKRYTASVEKWKKLKAQKVSDKLCQEIVGISRASFFRAQKILKDLAKGMAPPSKAPKTNRKRLWGEAEMQLILRLRRENPTYGKAKIAIILKRDFGQIISESTTGRILAHLKAKGLVLKSLSAVRQKHKRSFKKTFAKAWTFKEYAKMELGERVQIDHMTVTKNGTCIKHFQAWDRRSKFIHASIYSHAKSTSAKRFLLEFLEKVHSVQVDGGSEFRADFEQACAELELPLIVLPPRKPTYNGGVERGNRIFREEFYARPNLLADTLSAMRLELTKVLAKYNAYRPHAHLKGLTPLAYIQNNLLEACP